MLPELAAALLVVGLTAYAILGGADFGAGFWDLTAGGAERGSRVRGLIERSMGPIWEANHVWLVFVLVVCWTAFPPAFGAIMSTLIVPLFLAAIGIIARGSAFAFRGQAATVSQQRFFGAIFATSSIVTPFFLGAAVGAIASGRVPPGNAQGDLIGSWANPTGVIIGLLAVANGAYLAAVYMTADAQRGGLEDLIERMRLRALGAGAVAGILAIVALIVIREDSRALFDGLTGDGLPAVIISALAGVVALWLVWSRRLSLARVAGAAAVAAVAVGWALAQSPDILPGSLSIDEAAGAEATLGWLLACVGVGLFILGPSLFYLYRLLLQGNLDKEFKPLGSSEDRP
ncbi:MAG: cytochrome d ubiquinol oxidase subunit II [Miltoncostaeaceae bacterium]